MSLNRLSLNTAALNAGAGAGGACLASRAGAGTSISGQLGATILSQAGAISGITPSLGATLLSQAGARTGIDNSTLAMITPVLSMQAGAASDQSAFFTVTLASQAGATTAISAAVGQTAYLLMESGAKSGLTGTSAAILAPVTNRAGTTSSIIESALITLVNQAGASSTTSALSRAILSLLSQAGATTTAITANVAQTAVLLQQAGAASGLTATDQLLATLSNQAGAVSTLAVLPRDRLDIWVVNTRTGGVSRYTDLAVTSLAWVKGRLLLAGSAGLYELSGTADISQPIEASFTTGWMDFGTHLLKRMDSLNIGYESSGTLSLSSETSGGGVVTTETNPWLTVTALVPRDGVVKVGKGLKGRYWKFTISNLAGASFAIDKIDIHPLVLSRRR